MISRTPNVSLRSLGSYSLSLFSLFSIYHLLAPFLMSQKDLVASHSQQCARQRSYFLLPQLPNHLSKIKTMTGFMHTQVSSLPNSGDINGFNQDFKDFKDSGVEDICTSNRNHLVLMPGPENHTLIDNFLGDELESWDQSEILTSTWSQGELLDFDSSGCYSNDDSASLDPWNEALTNLFDLPPNLQTDNLSLDHAPDFGAAEWPMVLEDTPTNAPSLISVPVTQGNSYQPTPDLTECSTPTSLVTLNGSRDPTIRNLGSYDTDIQRWHAMLSRSRTADRFFLYGVLTTKIFCRPSCASRRPSRRHVRFFSFPGAIEFAEQAQFRPCKRCKPETLGTGNVAVLAVSQVLRRIIAETFGEQIEAGKEGLKLENLAKSAGLSTFHFHRLFKATTQVTPADFITACHALSLQDYLCAKSPQSTKSNPSAEQLPPHWSQRTARKALGGLKPEEYTNGAKSTSIEYCRVCTPVGDLEVAYSLNKNGRSLNLHSIRLSQDSSLPIGQHFEAPTRSEEHARFLQQCVQELEEKCKDRDTELAADVLSVLWRVRLWLKLTHDIRLR